MRILKLKIIGIFGIIPKTGTGDLICSTSTASGSGTRTISGTSSLAAAAATISSTGIRQVNSTDGTLACATAEIAGEGIVVTIKGTGTLDCATAETSGTGSRGSGGIGNLIVTTAELDGTGIREITGTGDLDCATATTSGNGQVGTIVSGTGVLESVIAELSGTGDRILTGTSTLTAAIVSILGTGDRIITGTNNLDAAIASISGTGIRGTTGTGSLISTTAEAEGTGGTEGIPSGSVPIYITPNGDDADDGSTELLAVKTFERAQELMSPGYELILLNGVYTLANNGTLNEYEWGGSPIPKSGQPISGINASQPTVYSAKNYGSVSVEGGLRFGLAQGDPSDKVSHIWVVGITFHDSINVYNGDYCTIKHCGAEGTMGCGTNDHDDGNQYNLFEDCWTWGKDERENLTNYRSSNNTYRRIVVMDNGCSNQWCDEGSGNYSVGSSIYNSSDCTFENVIMVDRFLDNANGYADFATAQHYTGSSAQSSGELNGRNFWLGCISVNSEDDFVNFEHDHVEPDGATNPTVTLTDCIGLESGEIGWDGSNRPGGGTSPGGEPCGYSYFTVNNLRSYGVNASIYVGCDVDDGGDPATDDPPTCSVHTITDLVADTYANRPNNLIPQVRYGTSDALWPYPNEARIKTEMSFLGGTPTTRDWTASGLTLSEYINSYDAGSGIITGSGDIAAAAAVASGTGIIGRIGTGDLDADIAAITGTGIREITGTGDLDAVIAEIEGIGTSGVLGSGTLDVEIAEISGVGSRGSIGTGDLDANITSITGTGVRIITGSGTPAAQTAEISGEGVLGYVGTGDLDAQTATITGVGVRGSVGTGSLDSITAEIDGTGQVEDIISGSGNITAQTATIIGEGTTTEIITGTGALEANIATIYAEEYIPFRRRLTMNSNNKLTLYR